MCESTVFCFLFLIMKIGKQKKDLISDSLSHAHNCKSGIKIICVEIFCINFEFFFFFVTLKLKVVQGEGLSKMDKSNTSRSSRQKLLL